MPRGPRRTRCAPEPDWVPFARDARVAVVVCDLRGQVVTASPHAAHLLGGAAAGGTLARLAAPASRAGLAAWLERVALAPEGTSVLGDVQIDADPPRALELEGTAVDDPAHGRVVVLVLHDVTQHNARAAELGARATTDPLTGLANTALFHDRLRQLTRADPPGWVAVVDLDHFERVNDRHGHAAGDAVLAEAARRMREVVPDESGATVARIGGEEFGVLLPGASGGDAEALVRRLLDALRRPHVLATVTASAGLAEILRAGDVGSGTLASSSALQHADAALYTAKASGRDRLVVHGPDLDAARAAVGERLAALERENADLAALARTDPLTGVGNRRRFDEDLTAVAASAARRGAPYAVLFIDLDEFGLVNKAWKETAGDATLRRTAHTIAGAVRAGDAVYRYGGEEFAALLPDATRAGAVGVCGRIRDALAARAIPHPTRGAVTASMGAASSADHGPAAADVVEAAIAGMHDAKSAGRDRIVAP